jgi:hypothetical protein
MKRFFSKRPDRFDAKRLIPQLFDASLVIDYHEDDAPLEVGEGNKVIERVFVPGVAINVLNRTDEKFAEYVCHRDLAEWRVSDEFAFDAADANLDTLSTTVTLKKYTVNGGEATYFMVEGAYSFAASLLRSKKLWSDFSIDINNIAAIVPDQFTLAFVNRHKPENLTFLKSLLSDLISDPSGKPVLHEMLFGSLDEPCGWTLLRPDGVDLN